MVIQKDFYFKSSDGEHKIHAVLWQPDDKNIRAIFQITHGMIEHIERYHDFAKFLTEQGFLVVGHDHLGHGHSVSSSEELGHISQKNGSSLLVEDMHLLRVQIQKEYPDKPYFILGHSMGSYLLRKYLTLYSDNLAGALIMGTGSVGDFSTHTAINICKFIALFHGWNYHSRFVEKMTRGKPFKSFSLNGKPAENSWLTKDVEIVKEHYSDPLCDFTFSLGAYRSMFEAVLYDNQIKNVRKIRKNLPIFLLSGANDPVGDFGKGVEKVYNLLQEVGVNDITYCLYKDNRHEILNETDRNQIYRDILFWCEKYMQ